MPREIVPNLLPFTCFECRSTFKRPPEKEVGVRKCPNCSGNAICMDVRFRPPKKSDNKQWRKVEFLISHGFFFQKIYRKEGPIWFREKYPDTLDQAKEFVINFKEQAFEIGI